MLSRSLIQLGRIYQRRALSTSCVSLAPLKLKEKLTKAIAFDKVPKDKTLFENKKQKALKEKNAKPVTDASARTLLSEILGRTFDENERIGPKTKFTEDELDKIFNNNSNLRLKFKVLGTSGNQIKESLFVDIDVRKFLDAGEDLKAKYMISLTYPDVGSYSLGTLLHYYIHTKSSMNKALDTVNWFKKRGFKLDKRSLGILLNAYGSKKEKILTNIINDSGEKIYREKTIFKPITILQAEKLIHIFNNSYEKQRNEVDTAHLNAILRNIFVLPQDQAIKFVERYIPGIFDPERNRDLNQKDPDRLKPNNATYSSIFKILANAQTNVLDILKKNEVLFEKIQKLNGSKNKPDQLTLMAYLNVLWNVNDIVIMMRTLKVMKDWFLVCKKEDIQQEIDISNLKKSSISSLSKGLRSINPSFQDPTYELDFTNLPEEIYGFLLSENDINRYKSKRFPVHPLIAEKYYRISDLLGLTDVVINDEKGNPIPNEFRLKITTIRPSRKERKRENKKL